MMSMHSLTKCVWQAIIIGLVWGGNLAVRLNHFFWTGLYPYPSNLICQATFHASRIMANISTLGISHKAMSLFEIVHIFLFIIVMFTFSNVKVLLMLFEAQKS